MRFKVLLLCFLASCSINTSILCNSVSETTERLKGICVHRCDFTDLEETLRCQDQNSVCVDYRLSRDNLANCLNSYK